MDGWDSVYAAKEKGGEQMIETKTELTKEEKIKLGLIRPYSVVADRMIVEDIEKGYTVKKIAQIYNRDVDDLKKHIGKIKGKIKSHRCKGEDANFKELYAAIFKKAAKDDIKKAKGMIYTELCNRGEDKKEIHKFIDENKDEIEKRVRESIMKEAEDYPETTKTKAGKNLIKIRNEFTKRR